MTILFEHGKKHSVPTRYVPNQLTTKDKQSAKRELMKSRKLYKRGVYYTRKPVASFKHKTSKHILRAMKKYDVESVKPSAKLARKTKCSVGALKRIVKKGEGAYYSSGSRPNQTAQSWGYARLASAITRGNAAKVDAHILKDGCKPDSPVFH